MKDFKDIANHVDLFLIAMTASAVISTAFCLCSAKLSGLLNRRVVRHLVPAKESAAKSEDMLLSPNVQGYGQGGDSHMLPGAAVNVSWMLSSSQRNSAASSAASSGNPSMGLPPPPPAVQGAAVNVSWRVSAGQQVEPAPGAAASGNRSMGLPPAPPAVQGWGTQTPNMQPSINGSVANTNDPAMDSWLQRSLQSSVLHRCEACGQFFSDGRSSADGKQWFCSPCWKACEAQAGTVQNPQPVIERPGFDSADWRVDRSASLQMQMPGLPGAERAPARRVTAKRMAGPIIIQQEAEEFEIPGRDTYGGCFHAAMTGTSTCRSGEMKVEEPTWQERFKALRGWTLKGNQWQARPEGRYISDTE